MSERVAIVAVAQTKYEDNKSPLWLGDLAYEPIEKVLQQTGLTYQDRIEDGFGIDRILTTMEDHFVGRACSAFFIHHYLGGFRMSHDCVSADGAFAVYHAVIDILSGHYDTVLVVSAVKESETSRSAIENCFFDHIYLQPLGLDYQMASGMQARRYIDRYHISLEQCAMAAVKSRRNAKNNPYAQEPLDITVEDVLNSKMLASPLRSLDGKPAVSDGACALILTTEEKAKQLTDKPVWVTGLANCYDVHYPGDRDLAECASLTTAAKKAYEMAGINDPVSEIDVAEISTEYSYQELLWSEGFGWCDKGDGGQLIESGVTGMKGSLPVNPSGGVLAGNPLAVAGAARVAEAVTQLQGEAGERQVEGAQMAIAHGFTGACGQSHCVFVLSK
ncbi:thiolase family protein [Thermodesulfobacteriota bacterium]